MNEQIRQLALQSQLVYETTDGKVYNSWENYVDLTEYVEKFAQLIVRECANLFVDQKYMVLNPHEPFANERVRALKEHDKDTVRKIKQHFGVEE
jgi:hypothetical protein